MVLLVIAAGVLTVFGVMAGLWVYAARRRNAGVVDIGWTAGMMIMAVTCLAATPAWRPRSAVAAAMVLVWGARLLIHLVPRVIGRPEDPRYATLRSSWGERAGSWFLYFFLGQGALVILLSLPLFIVRVNGRPEVSLFEWLGLALWLAALGGEWTSDHQLRRFKARPENRGRTCRTGLWKYSRHPNYFFEWCIWVALAVFAAGSPWGWTAFVCPVLMLYFLLRVTGIPPTEQQALRSRGDDYRAYQRTTSAFIPWFPGKEGS